MQNWKGQPYLFQETLIISEKKKKASYLYKLTLMDIK